MAKIVCVLYDDPADGYPTSYPRDTLPVLSGYPDGQSLPSPKAIDFTPGAMLGSVSGELGLRKYLESNGHTFVVTSSKDGANSVLDRELPDADIVISQPFWPAYMTAERFAKAKNLKMVVTAGIGSDHTDLQAAIQHNVTVAVAAAARARLCLESGHGRAGDGAGLCRRIAAGRGTIGTTGRRARTGPGADPVAAQFAVAGGDVSDHAPHAV